MRRRPLSIFAISFLDCICCGFGAVILVFMIISAKIEQESDAKLEALESDRDRLASIALAGESLLAQIRAELASATDQQASASQRKTRLGEDILATARALESETGRFHDAQMELEAQKALLAELEKTKQTKAATAEAGASQLRSIVAAGDRQYLTGLRMGGRHILVLVDASASMLASTLVNVIRLRYLPDEEKLRSAKWNQVVGTVDWLTANFPTDSSFQIYTFNTKANSVLAERDGAWIDVGDGSVLDEAVSRLRTTVPRDGTSLHSAFAAISRLNPRPDNVYLLVDGLPTQGAGPPRGPTVSGKERLQNFEMALRNLPRGVPINVILFAMEGDPYATDSYWKLARATQGSFMSPSPDWP